MPELVECLAHGILIQKLFADNANADWQLQNIWADATGAEMLVSPEGTRAREGYVYTLDHTSTIQRGNASSQTPVWPPMWSMQAPPGSQNSAAQPTPTPTTQTRSKISKKRKTRAKTRTARKKMAQRSTSIISHIVIIRHSLILIVLLGVLFHHTENTSSPSCNEENIEDPADRKGTEVHHGAPMMLTPRSLREREYGASSGES